MNRSSIDKRRVRIRTIQIFLVIGLTAVNILAQESPSVCQVEQALHNRGVTPPSALQCQTKTSCLGYITCAFTLGHKDTHKGDGVWHVELIQAVSAVLEKLPPPNPSPSLAEYYREFFVLLRDADPTSDLICAEANTQIRHFGPILRMLHERHPAKSLLDDKQEILVEFARLQYQHSSCFDKDVYNEAMTPPGSGNEDTRQVLAALLRQLSSTNQESERPGHQQDATRKIVSDNPTLSGGPK